MLFLYFLIKVLLTFNAVPISAIQQRDLFIHMYAFFFPFLILHHDLSQGIGYHSLCYTVDVVHLYFKLVYLVILWSAFFAFHFFSLGKVSSSFMWEYLGLQNLEERDRCYCTCNLKKIKIHLSYVHRNPGVGGSKLKKKSLL